MPALDRVLGGGVVAGGTVLLAGEPGHRQVDARCCSSPIVSPGTERKVLYASAEESPRQLRLRAERLGCASSAVLVVGETRLETVLDARAPAAETGGAPGRLDPGDRQRRAREPAGLDRPGAPLRQPAGRLRQALRVDALPGRARDQGGDDRRPEVARASGRHGAQLRGRARVGLPDPARDEEPLRPDRRDRDVRDARVGARAGARSVAGPARAPAPRRARFGGSADALRRAPAARRDPGAGESDQLPLAAADERRPRRQPRHPAGRRARALREARPRRPRRLPERRRRPRAQGARRRPRGRRGARSPPTAASPCRPTPSSSARSACSAKSAR